MRKIRVLVVDDSPTMLQLVANVLETDPGIEVVGLAPDAATARQAIKDFNPDVMTLDIEMPNMNGLDFLDKVMRLRPMPVVMVSTLTAKGSEASIEALQLGAIDCVIKPSTKNPNSFEELPHKVRIAAQARMRPRSIVQPVLQQTPTSGPEFAPNSKIVAIGSSTGGVEALLEVLSKFPKQCAPTVITQHMPAHFTASLANRLNRACAAKVVEATEGAPLKPGYIYLAPGGDAHLEIIGRAQFSCKLRLGDVVNGHRPSVDVLFNSVARCAGSQAVGVILTGMGRDGANGLLNMRECGARTIGQNMATSIVYGMPKAAYDLGAVGVQLPIEKIGAEIMSLTASASH